MFFIIADIVLIAKFRSCLKINNDLQVGFGKYSDLQQSVIDFYVMASMKSWQLAKSNIGILEIIDLKSKNLRLADVIEDRNSIIIFFPHNTCPTCYDLTAFIELASIGHEFKFVFITNTNNLLELSEQISLILPEASLYAFITIDAESILSQTTEALILYWNYHANRIDHILFFEKGISCSIIKHFLAQVKNTV